MTESKSTRAPKVYGLRKKQRKYAKLRGLKDADPTEAAREAYPDTKYPSQMAHALEKHPKVQDAIATFREYVDENFSDDVMMKKSKELFNAHMDEQPHYQVQQKQWDSMAKIKGYFGDPTEKHLHLHGSFIEKLAEDAVEDE